MVKKLIYSSYLQMQPIKWVGKMKRKFKKSIFLTKNSPIVFHKLPHNKVYYFKKDVSCSAISE